MKKNSTKNDKKGFLTVFLEDIGSIAAIIGRVIIAIFLVLILTVPVLFLFFKILSLCLSPLLAIPMKSYVQDLIVTLLITGVLIAILFLRRNKTNRIYEWILTGHIEIEISDENNRKMRALWLKTHKGKERTKPINWKITLNNKTSVHVLETVYPLDKYGHEEKAKAPVCYRVLVPITHKFFGNLPIQGDTIHFSWSTSSNNDIKNIRVKAVEFHEKNESIPDSKDEWIELDSKYIEGTICASDIKTGKKTKLEGTVTINQNVSEKIQLCFWYMPNEAEGESVLREKF